MGVLVFGNLLLNRSSGDRFSDQRGDKLRFGTISRTGRSTHSLFFRAQLVRNETIVELSNQKIH